MTARALTRPPSAFAAVLPTPFGAMGVRCGEQFIDELVFLPPGTAPVPARSALAELAVARITAWLEDPDRPFELPLAPRGTPFQRRVWEAIARIPRGQVSRYGALAAELGSAARAVGQACGANPFPLIVPCHRVVSAAGIGGFANAREGHLLDAKRWLLEYEARR